MKDVINETPNSLDDAMKIIEALRAELRLRPQAVAIKRCPESVVSVLSRGFREFVSVDQEWEIQIQTDEGELFTFHKATCVESPCEFAKFSVKRFSDGKSNIIVTRIEAKLAR